MKLKQEDRKLFADFFKQEEEWMFNNSLLVVSNLKMFRNKFLDYIETIHQESNISFLIFQLVIEKQIIEYEKELLIKEYNGVTKTTIRDLFHSNITDNKEILEFIGQAKIIKTVSETSKLELNKTIQEKIDINKKERNDSIEEVSGKYIR